MELRRVVSPRLRAPSSRSSRKKRAPRPSMDAPAELESRRRVFLGSPRRSILNSRSLRHRKPEQCGEGISRESRREPAVNRSVSESEQRWITRNDPAQCQNQNPTHTTVSVAQAPRLDNSRAHAAWLADLSLCCVARPQRCGHRIGLAPCTACKSTQPGDLSDSADSSRLRTPLLFHGVRS